MPPRKDNLSPVPKAQTELIKKWIDQGAKLDAGLDPEGRPGQGTSRPLEVAAAAGEVSVPGDHQRDGVHARRQAARRRRASRVDRVGSGDGQTAQAHLHACRARLCDGVPARRQARRRRRPAGPGRRRSHFRHERAGKGRRRRADSRRRQRREGHAQALARYRRFGALPRGFRRWQTHRGGRLRSHGPRLGIPVRQARTVDREPCRLGARRRFRSRRQALAHVQPRQDRQGLGPRRRRNRC